MIPSLLDKSFLKGTAALLVLFSLILSSCATTEQEIQAEEDSEASLVLVQEKPIAAAYVLGPEDVIQVLVWKDDSLTRTVMIRPDGKVSLPLVGEVQAAGLTPAQLANGVKKRLEKYYKEQPEVSVIVTEINSFAFFVLGEVNLPGKHILRRETTLLQAFSISGGFKQYADTKNIVLLRKEGSAEKRISINYKNLVSGKNSEENLLLRAGDTLIVP